MRAVDAAAPSEGLTLACAELKWLGELKPRAGLAGDSDGPVAPESWAAVSRRERAARPRFSMHFDK